MRHLMLVAVSTFSLMSCDDGASMGPPAAPVGAQTQAFLESLDRDLITPTYATLQTATAALSQSAGAWRDSPTDSSARAAAQADWQIAMDAWQQAEMLQIGPASRVGVGSAGLRDELYSWPQHNPCRIDQEVAKGAADSPDFAASRLVNAYGLDALEYLLFFEDVANQCPPQVPPNSDSAWSQMGDDEVTARRAQYAAAVAAQVHRDAQRLATDWDTFSDDLVAAYPNAQAALNAVFAALFYLDLVAKDAKIGDVAGITAGCASDACPENVESRWVGRDARNLRANLDAAHAILFGAPGAETVGFAALLSERGADALVIELQANLAAAMTAVDRLDAPFSELATTRTDDLRAAYTAIKAVTDLLKTQFVTTLNLSVPDEGAADND